MKLSTLSAAVAAMLVAAGSGSPSAQPHSDPQPGPAPGQAVAVASSSDTPRPPATQQRVQPSSADNPNKAVAEDGALTKEESEKALSILQTCSSNCHGVERFDGLGFDKLGW